MSAPPAPGRSPRQRGAVQVSLLGFPVRVELTLLLILTFFALGRPFEYLVSWLVVATAAILVHELGHAVAARAFGRSPSITLGGMGGLTTFAGGLSRGRSIVVSLAGSLTGIIVVGVPALVLRAGALGEEPPWSVLLDDAVFTTIGWGVLNLLPVLPLDGGNVAADLIGERPARYVSIVVAAAAGLYAYREGYTFAVLFALFFVADNYSRLKAARAPSPSPELDPRAAQRFLHSAGRYEEAVVAGRVLLERASGPGRAGVALDLARSTTRMGDLDGALSWLDLAVRLGFDDGRHLDADPDLAALRDAPGWPALRSRLPL